ncbi:MAG: tetratricopeptide repeat protein [Bacteroidales bacterium]|jgi:tetratricopeptide (TPR) repeat protein|nr:tetratricopeptide repeat protein [Bacteroidales bacterium]
MGLFGKFGKQKPILGDTVKLPIDDFFETYKYGLTGEIGRRVMNGLMKARMENLKYITVPKSDYDFILKQIESQNQRNYILQQTAALNNKGIELEKQGKIDEAIEVYEENIKLKERATHAYERLMILYHKRGDFENEKRVIKVAINVYSDGCDSYKKRLDKLENTYVKPEIILPASSIPFSISGIPLGVRFEQTIKLLPEFNFYYDLPENETTVIYLWKHRDLINDEKYKPEIWKIQGELGNLLAMAKKHEDNGNLDEAAIIYERLISEKDYHTIPYDRLVKIYSKAKLKLDEIRVLEYSINHFSELRKRQKEYVLYLAAKYGKLDFANERIVNNKKITYYGGAFELYNPYPIVEKWEEQLKKINKKEL